MSEIITKDIVEISPEEPVSFLHAMQKKILFPTPVTFHVKSVDITEESGNPNDVKEIFNKAELIFRTTERSEQSYIFPLSKHIEPEIKGDTPCVSLIDCSKANINGKVRVAVEAKIEWS